MDNNSLYGPSKLMIWNKSVHVTEITLLFRHHGLLDEVCCICFGHTAMFLSYIDQSTMNVFGHVLLVTTDVEVCSVFKPFPDFCTMLLEAMLNVDFLFLISFALLFTLLLVSYTPFFPSLALSPFLPSLPLQTSPNPV